MNYNFSDKEIVEYDNRAGLVGRGEVVGCATIPFPILGAMYLVKDVSGNLPSDVYPFEVFQCPEAFLRKV